MDTYIMLGKLKLKPWMIAFIATVIAAIAEWKYSEKNLGIIFMLGIILYILILFVKYSINEWEVT